MKKTTEISPGLLLHTTDRLGHNRAVIAVEYELEVRKNKLVIFEIDFTGSVNLELEGGGQSLKQKTSVEPGKRELVGVVRVLDPTRSWSLETKYTWVEENPGTVQPGQSKREKLAEGLILTTARASSPDTFSFHILNERNIPVALTLDCSKSVNLSMITLDDIGSTAKKDLSQVHVNLITLVIPAFERAHVCSLVVKDPTSGYQLKTKWSWIESPNGAIPNTSLRALSHSSPYEPSSSSRLAAPQPWVDSPNYNGSSFYSNVAYDPYTKSDRIPRSSLPSSTALIPTTPYQNNSSVYQKDPYGSYPRPSARPSPAVAIPQPRLKREEISPSVFLETEILDNLPRAEILYYIQVAKQTRVAFEADFSGSSNLALVPNGGLICEATVEPMSKAQVARLRVMDPSIGWKLVCRYKWQEEDVFPQHASANSIVPYEPPENHARSNSNRSSLSAPSAGTSEVRALLRSINLEAYAEFFEAEELTLELLRIMARDEAEFRRSLESLGVNKMGHRERILVAVKNLPVE